MYGVCSHNSQNSTYIMLLVSYISFSDGEDFLGSRAGELVGFNKMVLADDTHYVAREALSLLGSEVD